MVAKIPASVVVHDLIDIRTIEDSPSHEAEIVIIDLVRSSKLGFADDHNCVAVAMTKAWLAQFIVANPSLVGLRGLIGTLVATGTEDAMPLSRLKLNSTTRFARSVSRPAITSKRAKPT